MPFLAAKRVWALPQATCDRGVPGVVYVVKEHIHVDESRDSKL